ncbi:MAG TPA: class I SAM-dependent methyltransferase [Trebonia sp.]|jgi:SAM-dependent methyltransferase
MTDNLAGLGPQYEAAADRYSRHAANGLYNAHYDRPAGLELLGDVDGRHVLDAACGPGYYAAELLRRGARVTGLDNSPRMIELSRQLPGGEFRQHDLNDPLNWLPDDSVDLVLCALVYEYVDNRAGMLREFRRVLRPAGAVALTCLHPTGNWLRHGGSYFNSGIVEEHWGGDLDMRVRFWVEPLEATCATIAGAGFVIERLVEPRPRPEGAAVAPGLYEKLSTGPRGFLAFRLRPSAYPAAPAGPAAPGAPDAAGGQSNQ